MGAPVAGRAALLQALKETGEKPHKHRGVAVMGLRDVDAQSRARGHGARLCICPAARRLRALAHGPAGPSPVPPEFLSPAALRAVNWARPGPAARPGRDLGEAGAMQPA